MKCTFCGKNVAYVRPYDKLALCADHFNEQMVKRVRKTINKYKMFDRYERIAVGVSGGKDSIALLDILHTIEKRYPDSELVAITVDEGIAGYREEGLYYAKKHVERLGIEHHIFSFKEEFEEDLDGIINLLGERNKDERKFGACTYCGILRRKILNNAAKKINATVVATGHNLEDEAETVLLNVIRGDILRLGRQSPEPQKIHESLVPRVKPFRLTPQAEIVMYCIINDLEYQEVPCPYAVEAYRGTVRNFIMNTQTTQPMLGFNIVRGQDKIIPLLKLQKQKKQLKNCKSCGEAATGEYCKGCSLRRKLDALKNSK